MKNWWILFILGPASTRDNGPLLLFLLGNYITPGHVSRNLGIKTPNTNYQSCDHYKHNITPVSISFSHPDVSCPFYSLLDNYHCTGMSKSMSGVLWVYVVLKLYVRISCHHSRIVIIMSQIYYVRCQVIAYKSQVIADRCPVWSGDMPSYDT